MPRTDDRAGTLTQSEIERATAEMLRSVNGKPLSKKVVVKAMHELERVKISSALLELWEKGEAVVGTTSKGKLLWRMLPEDE